MAADLLLARLDGDRNGTDDADADAPDDERAVTAEPVLMPTDLVQRASTGRPTA